MQRSVMVGLCLAMLFTGALCVDAVTASVAADIKQKITENNKKIEEIQKEIDSLSSALTTTSKQAQTLKNTLTSLELTQKKLEANLKLTTANLSKTNLTLDELESDIADTEERIVSAETGMGQNIRASEMAESQSVIENFFQTRSMSDTWDYVNALHTIQGRVKIQLENLRDDRSLLGAKKELAEGEKAKLEIYKKTLSDQKKVVESNKQEKNQLLVDTQNKESTYKTVLADKIKEREVYEKELFDYESQLKITLDPTAIPSARSGLFMWPLDVVSVTQYFGKTVSAKRLYVSGTHGGIDFRASIGTPVKAVLSGVVTDTEAVRVKSGCQYGKWILVKHANGLSTVYGHLSVVSVKPGDPIITGDVIGYSGNTGYSTGPHLHFGVYATAGVRVVDSSSIGSNRCVGIKTVAANPAAYQDPMIYLPKL